MLAPWVHLRECPSCGGFLKRPFLRVASPQPVIHDRPGQRACRFLLYTDMHGEDHRHLPCPEYFTVEEFLENALGYERSRAA